MFANSFGHPWEPLTDKVVVSEASDLSDPVEAHYYSAKMGKSICRYCSNTNISYILEVNEVGKYRNLLCLWKSVGPICQVCEDEKKQPVCQRKRATPKPLGDRGFLQKESSKETREKGGCENQETSILRKAEKVFKKMKIEKFSRLYSLSNRRYLPLCTSHHLCGWQMGLLRSMCLR